MKISYKAVNTNTLLKKYKIPVQVNVTLTSTNAPGIENLFPLCKKLGVNKISLNSFQVIHDKHQYLKLNPEDNIFYNYLILKKHEEYPDINIKLKTLNIFDFLANSEAKKILDKEIKTMQKTSNPCLCCHNHDRFSISSNGDIFFCTMDESKDAIFGNIRHQNFYDIWNNRFSSPYFNKRNILTTKCKNCQYISFCNTGCMASAYKKYKDINMAPDECTYFEQYIMKGLSNE